jgi:hypothetical protein
MKHAIIASVIALAIAGPASAGDQLARSLGVEPGAYTLAELSTIKGLLDSGSSLDREEASVYEALAAHGVVSTQSVESSTAKAQLATFLGVNPADYTLAELAVMKTGFEN